MAATRPVPHPISATVRDLDAQDLQQRVLLGELLPRLEEAVREFRDGISDVSQGWRDVVRTLGVAAEVREETEDPAKVRESVIDAMKRADRELQLVRDAATTGFEKAHEDLVSALEAARSEIERTLEAPASEQGAGVQDSARRLRRRLELAWQATTRWFEQRATSLRNRFGLGTSADWAAHYQVRGSFYNRDGVKVAIAALVERLTGSKPSVNT